CVAQRLDHSGLSFFTIELLPIGPPTAGCAQIAGHPAWLLLAYSAARFSRRAAYCSLRSFLTVNSGRENSSSIVLTEPPAFSIFSWALLEKRCASTFSATSSSPRPRTTTG